MQTLLDLLQQLIYNHQDLVLCGFNSKGYDDWILMTILNGGNNERVKAHNDRIITDKKEAWTFPMIQFQRKPFKSFDLKDDLPYINIG